MIWNTQTIKRWTLVVQAGGRSRSRDPCVSELCFPQWAGRFLTGWFMNKIMTWDFSKMSAKNHFKMKSSKLLQNVDFKCKQPGEGVCLLCRIHYRGFWVQPLGAFAWDCFYATAWNMSRERAECGNSRIPGLIQVWVFSCLVREKSYMYNSFP